MLVILLTVIYNPTIFQSAQYSALYDALFFIEKLFLIKLNTVPDYIYTVVMLIQESDLCRTTTIENDWNKG